MRFRVLSAAAMAATLAPFAARASSLGCNPALSQLELILARLGLFNLTPAQIAANAAACDAATGAASVPEPSTFGLAAAALVLAVAWAVRRARRHG